MFWKIAIALAVLAVTIVFMVLLGHIGYEIGKKDKAGIPVPIRDWEELAGCFVFIMVGVIVLYVAFEPCFKAIWP